MNTSAEQGGNGITTNQGHDPAAGTTRQRPLRVAAYIRMGSSSVGTIQEFTLSVNKAYLEQEIDNNPDWSHAGFYVDTGFSSDHRPSLEKLLVDAKNGYIDLILVRSISSLHRNMERIMEIIHSLREQNIAILFMKENINTLEDDEFMAILQRPPVGYFQGL